MRALLFVIVGALFTIIPSISYAESDFVLTGNGFGKINDNVAKTSLQLFLQIQNSNKPVLEHGQISLGDDTYPIDDADVFLSENKKLIRLNAKVGDNTISASGKLVLEVNDDSIYQISGKTSTDNTFSVFARLIPTSTMLTLPESQAPKNEILLLVKQTERIEWKSPYKFTIRVFDPKQNPLSDFYGNMGYLEGIKISATVTDPIGDVIKTSTGQTQKFGYYEDSVTIPDNARTGIYKLTVTASGENRQSITREFTFVVIPISTGPTATS